MTTTFFEPAIRNRVLLATRPDALAFIAARLLTQPMEAGAVLFDQDAPLSHAVFPQLGVVSMMSHVEGSKSVEKVSIGNEGFLGLTYLMGGSSVVARTVVSLAGPAANLVLWQAFQLAATFAAGQGKGLPWMVLTTLASANWLLLIYNLLPAHPLDGGRVLEAWLTPLTGGSWATRIVAVLGLVVCAGLAYMALPDDFWLLLIAAMLSLYNFQVLQSAGGLRR